MTEQIIQGGESAEDIQARKNAWGAHLAAIAPYEYRVKRGEAYKQELGDTPGFDAAIADVLDAVIDATQVALDAAGAPAPAKFAEKKAKRDEIKLRHPKP